MTLSNKTKPVVLSVDTKNGHNLKYSLSGDNTKRKESVFSILLNSGDM